MKALHFTVPVTPGKTVIVQEDRIAHFYPYLHRHKEAQLIWILKGTGTLIADNHMHLFQPNDIFLLSPNQPHVFKDNTSENANSEGVNVHTISVFYDPAGSLSSILQLPELNQVNTFLKEHTNGFKLSAAYFKEVSAKIRRLQTAQNINQILYFLSLMKTLCKMGPKPEALSANLGNQYVSEDEGLRMGNIYNFISLHYNRDVSLEEAAAEAFLTPQAFCRYFKKHTGVTFVTFLNKMRINEACKRLTDGRYESISEVAYHCGFNSITNFNRVFKSISGNSPKEYVTRYMQNLPA